MKRKKMMSLIMVVVVAVVSVLGMSDVSRASTAPLSDATNIALAANGTDISTTHTNADMGEDYGVTRLIDGLSDNTDYFFMSAASTEYQNESMQVELQFDATYQIEKVRLYELHLGGFPKDFTIQAYTGNDWQTVKSVTDYQPNGTMSWHEFEVETVNCSAVRLSTTENGVFTGGSEYGIILGEFEVHGVEVVNTSLSNIALAANGTEITSNRISSFAEEYGISLDKMIDGDEGNYGITDECAKDDETTIDLTFKQTYLVSKVRMRTREYPTAPVDYTLSVWTANGWEEVATVENNQQSEDSEAEWLEHTFSEVACRAVRLSVTEHGKDGGNTYSIYMREFEVYGEETTTVIPTPSVDGGGEQPIEVKNIALAANGTKITSNRISSFGEENDIGLDEMIDGNDGNYGITDGCAKDEKTTIDLTFKQTYLVSKVRMRTREYPTAPVDYTLSVWTANGWKEVVTVKNYQQPADSEAEWLEHTFSEVACRAARLSVTEHGKDGGNTYAIYLREFEVYGAETAAVVSTPPADSNESTNVALATKGTSVSTSHNNAEMSAMGFGVDKLNDGLSAGTDYFFMSAASPSYKDTEIQVTLRFDGTYKIDKIRLYEMHLGGFPKDFTINAYTSNGWKTVKKVTNYSALGAEGWHVFTLDAVDCSAIRIKTTENGLFTGGSEYGLILGEFEAYGVASTVTVPAAPIDKTDVITGSSTGSAAGSASGATGGFTYNAEKNLALYVPATANSDYAIWGMGPDKMTDGDLYSFFSCDLLKSSKDVPEWVEVNLLKNYAIDTVVLYARNYGYGFPIDFTISVFYDGKWTEVVRKTGYSSPFAEGVTEHVFKFPATIGNQIRVEATNCQLADGEYGLQLNEVVVYGEAVSGDYVLPNSNIVTIGTEVTASTTLEDFNFYTEYLTDGNTATGYSSDQHMSPDNVEWIELDFKRSMSMGALRLKPAWGGNGFPVDFNVQVLVNDEWITALTVEDYEKPIDEAWQEFVFDKLYEASKLRITVTKLGEDFGQYCLKLNEIEVYPYATESEDLGAVEVVTSERSTYNSAEELNTKFDIPYVVLIAGILLIVLAIASGIIAYLRVSKKTK